MQLKIINQENLLLLEKEVRCLIHLLLYLEIFSMQSQYFLDSQGLILLIISFFLKEIWDNELYFDFKMIHTIFFLHFQYFLNDFNFIFIHAIIFLKAFFVFFFKLSYFLFMNFNHQIMI